MDPSHLVIHCILVLRMHQGRRARTVTRLRLDSANHAPSSCKAAGQITAWPFTPPSHHAVPAWESMRSHSGALLLECPLGRHTHTAPAPIPPHPPPCHSLARPFLCRASLLTLPAPPAHGLAGAAHPRPGRARASASSWTHASFPPLGLYDLHVRHAILPSGAVVAGPRRPSHPRLLSSGACLAAPVHPGHPSPPARSSPALTAQPDYGWPRGQPCGDIGGQNFAFLLNSS